MITREIYIKTQFIGFHKYVDAPDDVSFLHNNHRHVFNVKVQIPVFHNNREIEFFILQSEINNYISKNINHNDTGSCESIAEKIALYITEKYKRKCQVTVNEDNENGAIIITDMDRERS